MARLRANFKGGTITNSPLTVGATSATSAEFTSLPVVASPDTLTIVLDPDSTSPEIAHVTAHASADNTVTLLRGQEASAAKEHAAGTVWIHAPTADDFVAPVTGAFVVEPVPTVPSAYDDEFSSASLTGWTAVNRSGGPAVVWTQGNGVLSCYHPGGDLAAEHHGLVKSLGSLTPPVHIRTAARAYGRRDNYFMFDLCFSSSATYDSGVQVMARNYWISADYLQTDVNHITNWKTDTGSHGAAAYTFGAGGWLYMRLSWLATNSWRYQASPDGVSWITIASPTITMTPTHFGFAVSTWTSATPKIATFEHFRVS